MSSNKTRKDPDVHSEFRIILSSRLSSLLCETEKDVRDAMNTCRHLPTFEFVTEIYITKV